MAMNKTEQAEMARLMNEMALIRALSWPSYREPAMVPPPTEDRACLSGYMANPAVAWNHGFKAGDVVVPAWSRANEHRRGTFEPEKGQIGSRGSVPLHATKRDALLALRLDMTRRAAALLAEIDAAIDAEGEG